MRYLKDVEMADLVGKTITAIEVNEAKDEFKFACSDDSIYLMYHSQDCCESVSIEEIIGDLEDLIGNPLLISEEVSHINETPPEFVGTDKDHVDESYTWTFYKFATVKGSVTIRWYGSSNGYYSESVFLEMIEAGKEKTNADD